jgi:hypothetical protein
VRSSAIGETPFVETIPQIFCPVRVAPNTISRDSHPSGEGKFLGLIPRHALLRPVILAEAPGFQADGVLCLDQV